MEKRGMMCNCGKSKVLYNEEQNSGNYIMSFLDNVSSYTYNKNERIIGTGKVRCDISSYIFNLIDKRGLKNHYISNLGNGNMRVRKLEMLKLEIIPRNIAAGSIVRNFPVRYGEIFENPILKMDMKYANDPMLNTDYIIAMGIATRKEVSVIRDIAFELNDILKEVFLKSGMLLVDFKFEVGRNEKGEIIIGDEISPDGMRIWDQTTQNSMDKDVFRLGTGDLLEVYTEVEKRLTGK